MIDLHDVSIAYDGAAVISGMSFSIAPGEIVVLVGENGCGKSTLGRAICAAQLVDGGAVVVDGHDPSASELERLRVRELVGYVRQDPLDQIVSSLVFDEVAFGPRNLGIDSQHTSPVVSRNVVHSPECWPCARAIRCSTTLPPNITLAPVSLCAACSPRSPMTVAWGSLSSPMMTPRQRWLIGSSCVTEPVLAVRPVVRLILAPRPASKLAYESTLDDESLAELQERP